MDNHFPFPVSKHTVPHITTNQMIEVDRLMIAEYGINLFQMMENAGRSLATLTRELIKHNKSKKIIIFAGSGGNGGGGITAARRLHNWGYKVNVVITSKPDKFNDTIKAQFDIIKKMKIEIFNSHNLDFSNKYDIIIDAIIGYSLKGKLRKNVIDIISLINKQDSTVISLDVPSGIDSTTGEIASTCIKANYTMTLALPKTGFLNTIAKKYTGKVLLADISVPPALYKNAFNIELPNLFNTNDIVCL